MPRKHGQSDALISCLALRDVRANNKARKSADRARREGEETGIFPTYDGFLTAISFLFPSLLLSLRGIRRSPRNTSTSYLLW